MQLELVFATFTAILASNVVFAAEGDVLTATRVFHTLIKEVPFIVDATETITWKQGASIIENLPIPTEVDETIVYGESPTQVAAKLDFAPSVRGFLLDYVSRTGYTCTVKLKRVVGPAEILRDPLKRNNVKVVVVPVFGDGSGM